MKRVVKELEVDLQPSATSSQTSLSFWSPPGSWQEALPLGNGRLGGLIWGGIAEERLKLNESTLWSGFRHDWVHPQSQQLNTELRQAILQGRTEDAARTAQELIGPSLDVPLPLGDIVMRFAEHPGLDASSEPVSDYRRELDLETAVARTEFLAGGFRFTRQAFASHPDQVLVVRLETTRPRGLSFTIQLDGCLPGAQQEAGQAGEFCYLRVNGRAPSRGDVSAPSDEQNRGLAFAAAVALLVEGPSGHAGQVDAELRQVRIEQARAVTLIVAARTGFLGPHAVPMALREVVALVERDVERVASRPFATLLQQHVADHQRVFKRARLTLGADDQGLPTDECVQQFCACAVNEQDPGVHALLFQYARYLLIAGSRDSATPMSPQGLWQTADVRNAGQDTASGHYRLAGPLQMTYGLAEVAALPECHVALLRFVQSLRRSGAATARLDHGAQGWVSHAGSDLWCSTHPSPSEALRPGEACWPLAGAWLSLHLWDHYAFGGDVGYLRDVAYPIMRDSVAFALAWLVETHRDQLLPAPSITLAPLSEQASRMPSLGIASTFDISLLWELFTDFVEAASLLECDPDLRARVELARAALPKLDVGRQGQLLAWAKDADPASETEAYAASLFGLYPGRRITRLSEPTLFEAARRTLYQQRDEGQLELASVWRLSCWARLGDGDQVLRGLAALLKPALSPPELGLAPNLMPIGDGFSLHCLFGIATALTELLLQSHGDTIDLLPALPTSWRSGSATGLRARSGYDVDLRWAEGQLTLATLIVRTSGVCRLRAPVPVRVERGGELVAYETQRSGEIRFPARAGDVFKVLPERGSC